jgi:hypothetical protein
MTHHDDIGQHSHVFRPGLFRATRAYWLNGGVMHWRIGKNTGHIALSEIAALHLCTPPPNSSSSASCVLIETSGRRHRIEEHHWFGWTLGERHRFGQRQQRIATFRGLVSTLARRIRKANPGAKLLCGAGATAPPEALTPFDPDRLHAADAATWSTLTRFQR